MKKPSGGRPRGSAASAAAAARGFLESAFAPTERERDALAVFLAVLAAVSALSSAMS